MFGGWSGTLSNPFQLFDPTLAKLKMNYTDSRFHALSPGVLKSFDLLDRHITSLIKLILNWCSFSAAHGFTSCQAYLFDCLACSDLCNRFPKTRYLPISGYFSGFANSFASFRRCTIMVTLYGKCFSPSLSVSSCQHLQQLDYQYHPREEHIKKPGDINTVLNK